MAGFYCSPDLQKIHLGLTVLVFITGIIAPWIEYQINGVEIRPFVLASMVFIGVVPFGHWLYITPEVYRNEVTKVRVCYNVREFLLSTVLVSRI